MPFCKSRGSQVTTRTSFFLLAIIAIASFTLFPLNPASAINSPRVTIMPTSVVQGQSVTYSGTNFTPKAKVSILVDSGIPTVGYIVGTPTASSSGRIGGSFIAGTNIVPGSRLVTFTDKSTGATATATLQVIGKTYVLTVSFGFASECRYVIVKTNLISGGKIVASTSLALGCKTSKFVKFSALNPGTYTVTISGSGVTTQSQTVTITTSDKTVNFTV